MGGEDQVIQSSHYTTTDLKIYSEHYIPNEDAELGELFPYDNESDLADEDETDIDLMATSESEESNYELTNEDIAFLEDDEDLVEDISFYRAIENQK